MVELKDLDRVEEPVEFEYESNGRERWVYEFGLYKSRVSIIDFEDRTSYSAEIPCEPGTSIINLKKGKEELKELIKKNLKDKLSNKISNEMCTSFLEALEGVD